MGSNTDGAYVSDGMHSSSSRAVSNGGRYQAKINFGTDLGGGFARGSEPSSRYRTQTGGREGPSQYGSRSGDPMAPDGGSSI